MVKLRTILASFFGSAIVSPDPTNELKSAPDYAALENAISAAGRDSVFALMNAWGWNSTSTPPVYIWWEAVRSVNERNSAQTCPCN